MPISLRNPELAPISMDPLIQYEGTNTMIEEDL